MKNFFLALVLACFFACTTSKTTTTETTTAPADTVAIKDSIVYYETDFEARQKDYFDLLQGSWVIDTMRRQARAEAEILDGVTLQFGSDTLFSGKAICNNIRGAYRLKGTSIKFLNIASTKMGCANGAQEAAYLNLLTETVSAYTVTDKTLLLRDGASNIVFSAHRQ